MSKVKARQLAHELRRLGVFAVAAPQPAVKDFRVIIQTSDGSRGFTDERACRAFIDTLRAAAP